MPETASIRRIELIARVARRWRDPEHGPRREAVKQTLAAPNRHTAEALAYAVNHRMHRLTPEALRAWVAGRIAPRRRTVAVLYDGAGPLAELRDGLAVGLAGHACRVARRAASPALVPAFVDELLDEEGAVALFDVRFDEAEAAVAEADAVTGVVDEPMREQVEAWCVAYGVPPKRRRLGAPRRAVAVLDGQEGEEEREAWAEDALLHGGASPWAAAVVWAPRGLDPDPYLEAMARFRSVFPAHPDLPGALEMQRAFLAAADRPHAYGEGLEFLLSRGEPEPQAAGHVRWSEYDHPAEVARWLTGAAARVQAVAARPGLGFEVPEGVPRVPLGTLHRPPLDHHGTSRDDPFGWLATL